MEVKKVDPGYILAYWDPISGEDFEVCQWKRMHRAVDKDKKGKKAYYLFITKGEQIIIKKDGKQIVYVCE